MFPLFSSFSPQTVLWTPGKLKLKRDERNHQAGTHPCAVLGTTGMAGGRTIKDDACYDARKNYIHAKLEMHLLCTRKYYMSVGMKRYQWRNPQHKTTNIILSVLYRPDLACARCNTQAKGQPGAMFRKHVIRVFGGRLLYDITQVESVHCTKNQMH